MELTPEQQDFDYSRLEFEVGLPHKELDAFSIEALRRAAYSSQFAIEYGGERDETEINHFLQPTLGALSLYQKYRFPEPPDEDGFRSQGYGNTRTVTATYNGKLIGFGAKADNVSGNPFVRTVKMMGARRRWAWLREIAVEPGYQKLGVGTKMAELLLERCDDDQPASAYTLAESPAGAKFASSLGLLSAKRADGEVDKTPVHVFGADAAPAQQIRWSAIDVPLVRSVIRSKMTKDTIDLSSVLRV